MRRHDYLDHDIETASPKQIRQRQEAELARQLDSLFARSLFYQEKFRSAGLRRKDCRHLRDLAQFPFTTKEELRENQTSCPPLGRHIAANWQKRDSGAQFHRHDGADRYRPRYEMKGQLVKHLYQNKAQDAAGRRKVLV